MKTLKVQSLNSIPVVTSISVKTISVKTISPLLPLDHVRNISPLLPLNKKDKIIIVLSLFPLLLMLRTELSTPFHPVPDVVVKPEFRNNVNKQIPEVILVGYKKLTLKEWSRLLNRLNKNPNLIFIWALAYIIGFWILLIYFPSNFKFLFLQRSKIEEKEKRLQCSERMRKLVTMGRGPRKPSNWWDRLIKTLSQKWEKANHIVETYRIYKTLSQKWNRLIKTLSQKWEKTKEVLQRQYFYEQKIWEGLFNDPRDVLP